MRFSFVPNHVAGGPRFPVRCFAYRNLEVSEGRAKLTSWLVYDKNKPALAGWFAFRILEVDQQLVVSPERSHGTAVALPAEDVPFEMTVYARMVRPYSSEGGGSSVPMVPDFLHLCYWALAVEVEAETYLDPMASPSDVPQLFDYYRCVDYLVRAGRKAIVAAPKGHY